MLADAGMRGSFRGGNLGAWLRTIARRAAIDLLRKRRREEPAPDDDTWVAPDPSRDDEERDAKRLVERFRAEILPEKYAPLFQARFLEQLPQREAADRLGMSRSTLVYQESRVRELLTTFLLTTSPGGGS
jgi:RNA polymerase sigma-70 factor (ECF subfamily)